MLRRQLTVLVPIVALACALAAPVARAQGTSNVTLSWTAPGDDGNIGTASQYEVRFSTSPITAANFGSATLVTSGVPAPLPAGSAQNMFLTGLQPQTSYWVAVRTADDRGNWSAISNVVNFMTTAGDTTRPAALALTLGGTGTSSVTLDWTATGDDSLSGVAHHYDVRWSGAPITGANFAAATAVTSGVPAPAAPGTAQACTIVGLNRSVDLYFAVRVYDESGNGSALSNVLLVTRLLDTAPPASPTGVTASVQGGSVRVQWSANSEPDLAGYNVWRAPASSGPFTRLNGTMLTGLEYTDAAPPDSASLWYAVTALDASGNESGRSAAQQVWLQAAAVAAMRLLPAYPNPSPRAGAVTLPVEVPATGPFDARIDILNGAGERVRTLDLSGLVPGTNAVAWDGRNDDRRECAPGVYRAWLRAGSVSQQVKLVRTP